MKRVLTRLFIDPALNSSGWAVFKGKRCVAHGSFENPKGYRDEDRYQRQALYYKRLAEKYKANEVHIEKFVGKFVSYKLHMVVGALIGSMLCFKVSQNIHVGQWQSAMKWKEIKTDWKKKRSFGSEDEWAAYLMGKYWVKEND